MMVREKVDFPQPDSPTRPRISPFSRLRLTPSTARTMCLPGENTEPVRWLKWVWRFLISKYDTPGTMQEMARTAREIPPRRRLFVQFRETRLRAGGF